MYKLKQLFDSPMFPISENQVYMF